MPRAAEQYAAMLDAVEEQQLRLFGPRPADIWTGQSAAQFRFDPHRELDGNLAALASYVMPTTWWWTLAAARAASPCPWPCAAARC